LFDCLASPNAPTPWEHSRRLSKVAALSGKPIDVRPRDWWIEQLRNLSSVEKAIRH
jgi:hypothetical protein